MQLHLRINAMTITEAEVFINQNTPFQVDEINKEFETVIFEVKDQVDADSFRKGYSLWIADQSVAAGNNDGSPQGKTAPAHDGISFLSAAKIGRATQHLAKVDRDRHLGKNFRALGFGSYRPRIG